MKTTFKRYLPYLKEHRGRYLLVLLGIVMTVSATAATAQIMKPLMDRMFIEREASMLYLIPLGLVAIYFVKSAGRYIQVVYMEYIGTTSSPGCAASCSNASSIWTWPSSTPTAAGSLSAA